MHKITLDRFKSTSRNMNLTLAEDSRSKSAKITDEKVKLF